MLVSASGLVRSKYTIGETTMSFRNSTIVTGGALGLMLALGAVNNASAGHDGYGYAPKNGDGAYHGFQKSGFFVKTGMHESEKTEAGKPAGDVVDVAVGAGSFTTLVEAVKAAGLVETLKGEGPFTVFAPTDEAFAKIAKDDLDALLADKEKLTAVLTYHVVPGKVLAADVVKLDSAKTVQGGIVTIDTSDGVKVDDAKVVKTDVMASNGVIHVIDTVIMPK